jgi:hypothetical protein
MDNFSLPANGSDGFAYQGDNKQLHGRHGSGDGDEMRRMMTGGATDGWYQAPLPMASQPANQGTMCYVQVPSHMVPCVLATNQMMPTMAVNAPAMQFGNQVQIVQRSVAPATQDSAGVSNTQRTPLRTPLRSGAALFQPGRAEPVTEQNETVIVTGATPTESVTRTPLTTVAKTTLMLRNIPQGVTRSMVWELLQSEGFANQVRFMYLPIDLKSFDNFGYTFVDFDCTKVAEQCKERLDNFIWRSDSKEIKLEAAWSETQGVNSFVQRYRDSPLMHESLEDALKPAMFKQGVRIAFPSPTKPIKAPRLRRNSD